MIKGIIILLFSMIAVGQIHSVIEVIRPGALMKDASAWFVYSLPENYITAGWWLYEIEGLLERFVLCAILVMLAKNISKRLYYAALFYFVHCIFISVMFIIYYKKPAWMFWITGALFMIIAGLLFLPEKKSAIIKQIQ